MCTECVSDPKEIREFLQDRYYAEYAKPTLTIEKITAEGALEAVSFAVANAKNYGYTVEQVANLLMLASNLQRATSEEEKDAATQAVTAYLTELVSQRWTGMDIAANPLSVPTKATIADDVDAWHDETPAERIYRGIQHMYYYHETRPQYMLEIFGQEALEGIAERMKTYVYQAMSDMPQFGSAILVLDEPAAAEALTNIALTVYLEALMAGYYAGAKALNCLMWQTHELGPTGRLDERDVETKVAEGLAQFEKYKEEK